MRLVFGAPVSGGSNQAREHSCAVLRPGDRPTDGGRHVIDAEGHAFAVYAASPGDSVLVRPDGYLA